MKSPENPMLEPRIGKVVVNISTGRSGEILEKAKSIMRELTGQEPCTRRAKRTIRSFGIRKGEPIACMVTLRGVKAEVFLEKSLSAIGRRVHESSFDEEGNFAFGVKEHIDLPGTRYDPQLGIFGMNIVVNVERPGYRVSRRRRCKTKVGKSHRVSVEEAVEFIRGRLGAEVVRESE